MSRKKIWKLFRTGLLQDLRALEAEEVVCEVERVRALVERFDIEPLPDFSAK